MFGTKQTQSWEWIYTTVPVPAFMKKEIGVGAILLRRRPRRVDDQGGTEPQSAENSLKSENATPPRVTACALDTETHNPNRSDMQSPSGNGMAGAVSFGAATASPQRSMVQA
jgi:hypothetical protein